LGSTNNFILETEAGYLLYRTCFSEIPFIVSLREVTSPVLYDKRDRGILFQTGMFEAPVFSLGEVPFRGFVSRNNPFPQSRIQGKELQTRPETLSRL